MWTISPMTVFEIIRGINEMHQLQRRTPWRFPSGHMYRMKYCGNRFTHVVGNHWQHIEHSQRRYAHDWSRALRVAKVTPTAGGHRRAETQRMYSMRRMTTSVPDAMTPMIDETISPYHCSEQIKKETWTNGRRSAQPQPPNMNGPRSAAGLAHVRVRNAHGHALAHGRALAAAQENRRRQPLDRPRNGQPPLKAHVHDCTWRILNQAWATDARGRRNC